MRINSASMRLIRTNASPIACQMRSTPAIDYRVVARRSG
jgi:hypothetical protein